MIFKEMGIFDENYHRKYRKDLLQKRYKLYIENVKLDMYAKFFDARLKRQIEKLIKEKYPEPDFVYLDIPK